MATITFEYNARSGFAQKFIDAALASKVFSIAENKQKTTAQKRNRNLEKTLKAIDDAKKGKVIICHSFDEYKNAVK